MSYTTLHIIGNGFDLAHHMPTQYIYFKQWLIKIGRLDVILELEKAFPKKNGHDFMLWSDFEDALGEYDIKEVADWNWESLYLVENAISGVHFEDMNGSMLLDVELINILSNAFTSWVKQIPIANVRAFNLSQDTVYLTFNYTDTLEVLYNISENQVLHIHGRASKNEKLIFGHNKLINPGDYWDNKLDVQENNSRMQHLIDMNNMRKPYEKVIERYSHFFDQLSTVKDVYINGHSCSEIDYPYFHKIKSSVACNARWHFNPYDEETTVRVEKLKGILEL